MPKLGGGANLYIRRWIGQGNKWSGYFVQVRGHRGARLFSLRKYRSERAALQAARAYRDQFVERLQLPAHNGRYVLRKPQANNKLGILGVHETYSKGRGHAPQHAIVASCRMPDGRQMRRVYPVAKYGRDTALALARVARAELVAMKLNWPANQPTKRRKK